MSYWDKPSYTDIKLLGSTQALHQMPQVYTPVDGQEFDIGEFLASGMYTGFNFAVGFAENSSERTPEDIQKEVKKLETDLKGILSGINNSASLDAAYSYYQEQSVQFNTLESENNAKIAKNNGERATNNNKIISEAPGKITELESQISALENSSDEGNIDSGSPITQAQKDQQIATLNEQIEEIKRQKEEAEQDNAKIPEENKKLQDEINTAKKTLDTIKKNYDAAVKIQQRINELENKAKNTSVPGKTSNMKDFNDAFREWQTASAGNDPKKKKSAAEKLKKAYEAFGESVSPSVKQLYEANKAQIEAALNAK